MYAPLGASIEAPDRWGPWVIFPAESHSRTQIEAALRARSAPVVVAAESHQSDVLRQMVGLGLGWTVLPAVQGPDARVAVTGPELLTRRIVTVRRDGALTDPAVDELVSRPHVSCR